MKPCRPNGVVKKEGLTVTALDTTLNHETLTGMTGLAMSVPFRGGLEQDLDLLKMRLLGPALQKAHDHELMDMLLWAGNEAAARAWLTPYPFLVLPSLLEEFVEGARQKYFRQKWIRRKSQAVLQAA